MSNILSPPSLVSATLLPIAHSFPTLVLRLLLLVGREVDEEFKSYLLKKKNLKELSSAVQCESGEGEASAKDDDDDDTKHEIPKRDFFRQGIKRNGSSLSLARERCMHCTHAS